MNAALSTVNTVKTRSRATARQLPPSRSSCSSGDRTRASTSMYATKVAQSITKRTVNEPG
jgi:hypothetical protein